jgi:uncharacterized repeat protein (TIGR03803 family)
MAPDGSNYTLLHIFTGGQTDGATPFGGLIQGPDGTLYGTTRGGGLLSEGTIFQMAPDGSGFMVLHSFTGAPTDGLNPIGGMIQGLDGMLYGTTTYGGSGSGCDSGCGTIFRIAPNGSGYTLLHNFTVGATDGYLPTGVIQGPDGTLYGTTSFGGAADAGTIYQLAPDGSGFTLLHSFSGPPTDGWNPQGALVQGSDGTLYGTTYVGGSGSGGSYCTTGCGTVFQIAPGGSGYTLLHNFLGAADRRRSAWWQPVSRTRRHTLWDDRCWWPYW